MPTTKIVLRQEMSDSAERSFRHDVTMNLSVLPWDSHDLESPSYINQSATESWMKGDKKRQRDRERDRDGTLVPH